jgi:uncharacterized membrane protein SpoIIM required for sporulation
MSHFVSSHKSEWDELGALIERGRKSIRRLSPNERERLDELYRRTTVHLARVTTRTRDQHLINYLSQLTASAHSLIYLPPRESIWRGAARFIVEGFGRVIIRHWRLHLLSAVLVIGGGLVGFFAASADPMVAHALWPAGDVRQPGSTPNQLLTVLRSGREGGGGEKFLFASFLFQHNLKVGLLALATGVLASLPTVLLMIFNGMLMGVFVSIHYQAGIKAEMWAWILPHGVTELGAIMLCGGGRNGAGPGGRTSGLVLAATESGECWPRSSPGVPGCWLDACGRGDYRKLCPAKSLVDERAAGVRCCNGCVLAGVFRSWCDQRTRGESDGTSD